MVIFAIVWYRYDQYVVQRNFIIHAAAPCDSSEGTCFVADCSPEDDETCDLTPYKKVELLANKAPACLEEHTCASFACAAIDSCTETYCDEESLEEGEVCETAGSETSGIEESLTSEAADLPDEATIQ